MLAAHRVGAAGTALSTSNNWSHLPVQLRHLVDIYGSRHASTTTSCPYPYPTHSHPTPQQIFHLPHGASQSDIKARYYELVRFHHPDSTFARSLSPQVAQTRFQSVSSAYDILRGKLPPPGSHPFSSPYSPFHQPTDPIEVEIRRRQAAYRRRNAEWTRAQSSAGMDSASNTWDPGRSADERWKDRVIVCAGIVTLAIGLYPSIFMLRDAGDEHHVLASKNLTQARTDAKEFGDSRRREVRRRVSEFRFLDQIIEEEMQRDRERDSVLALPPPGGGSDRK